MSAVRERCFELQEMLASAQPEERIGTLRDVAFEFGQFVGGGVLPESKARELLLQGAQTCGLVEEDGEHTASEVISSNLERGKKNPRQTPESSIDNTNRADEPHSDADDSEGNAPQEKPKMKSSFQRSFSLSESGLWHTDEDGEKTWLGPPLHVLAMTRDERSNAWGLWLEWEDPDGKRHTWAMPKSLLAGRDASVWLGRLADEGWNGNPSSHAKKLLALYLSTRHTPRRVLCVPRTGWHNGAFVLPDNVFYVGTVGIVGNASNDEVVSHSDKPDVVSELSEQKIVLQHATARNPYLVGGTFEEWKATVGKWTQGNSRLELSVCIALAAPMLDVAGMEGGGFNLAGQSSTGKTTALCVGGSISGRGTQSGGYVQTWKSTDNAVENLAELHNDTALFLDELSQASGHAAAEVVYMISNGAGKNRMRRDGGAREQKTWRVLVLSSGEVGLAERLGEEGKAAKAGQAARLVDVSADAGCGLGLFENLHGHADPRAFAESLKDASQKHYGHALRAFIQNLVQRRAEVEEWLPGWMDAELKKWCPKDATGQVQRVARRFLLCASAGELATQWNILPWAEGEALSGIKKCFDAWLESRGGAASEAHEDTAFVRQVTLFLEKDGASRFHDLDSNDSDASSRIINRAGLRATKDNQTIYYVLPEVFRAEVCKGFSLKRAIEVLLERGMLWKGEGRNVMRKPHKNLPEFANKRFYALVAPGTENEEPIPTIPTSNNSCRNGEVCETNSVSDTSDHSDTKTHELRKNALPDRVVL